MQESRRAVNRNFMQSFLGGDDDEAGYQKQVRRKAKGPLSSGPASEALGGESEGKKCGSCGTASQELLLRGFHTTWKVGAPEVASVVVGIDAGCGGKLAGPRKIFLGIISLVESVL